MCFWFVLDLINLILDNRTNLILDVSDICSVIALVKEDWQ